MAWSKLNQYTITQNGYNITKPGRLEGIPFPYGLFNPQKELIGHYPSAEAAKSAYTELIAGKKSVSSPTNLER